MCAKIDASASAAAVSLARWRSSNGSSRTRAWVSVVAARSIASDEELGLLFLDARQEALQRVVERSEREIDVFVTHRGRRAVHQARRARDAALQHLEMQQLVDVARAQDAGQRVARAGEHRVGEVDVRERSQS